MDHNLKNITRYTYDDSSFLGWRVAFCRNGRHFTRYFPDRTYGGKDRSLEAAMEVRDAMRHLLDRQSDDTDAIFQLFQGLKSKLKYPAAMKPPKRNRKGNGSSGEPPPPS